MEATINKTTEAGADRESGHGISFGEAFRVWLRVAVLSFGGPAGQIAVMHRILVEEKNWISESRFLHALNYCMLVPVAALLITFGEANVFSQIALFFSKMAMVTFGGAYAVLAYVAQQAVEHYHW